MVIPREDAGLAAGGELKYRALGYLDSGVFGSGEEEGISLRFDAVGTELEGAAFSIALVFAEL